MDPSPSTWELLRRNKWSVLGRAAGIGASAFSAIAEGWRQRSRLNSLRSRGFPTWSSSYRGSKMPVRRVSTRRPRRRYRTSYRRSGRSSFQNLTRSTGVFTTFSIPAAGLTAFKGDNIQLGYVKTSDLITAFDVYRIKKVDLVITQRVDPASSGITNNNVVQVMAACDPVTSAAPTAALDVGAFDNHKVTFLTSGKSWVYSFYPKAVNTVDNAGVTSATGSYSTNPWIQLTVNGCVIPHNSCLMAAQCSAPAPTAGLVMQYYYRIHFQVKNIR